MLESEIDILQDMDFDIDLTGFDDVEIGEMFPIDPEPEDFDAEAAMVELGNVAETQVGEIIELGKHRFCCTQIKNVQHMRQIWIYSNIFSLESVNFQRLVC